MRVLATAAEINAELIRLLRTCSSCQVAVAWALVGFKAFSEAQRRILALTQEYLAIFFDCPVKVQRQIALASIPTRARRTHPSWGDPQVLTGYILHEVLEPERPANALAYLALIASDLWPAKGWNFVFGEASLRQRIGVWSIYRNGDPETDFRLCLRRTLSTASHETGHILCMAHCTAYLCLMNDSNHQEEKDRRPMHPCPVCLRKLCWNLRVEPVPYLTKLKAFCQQNGLDPESGWYERALATWQPESTSMKLTCTVSRLANGKWLARHTGSSTGQVEVTAPTREEALTKMRDELQYRIEWCPCSGASGDTVQLQVREEAGRNDRPGRRLS